MEYINSQYNFHNSEPVYMGGPSPFTGSVPHHHNKDPDQMCDQGNQVSQNVDQNQQRALDVNDVLTSDRASKESAMLADKLQMTEIRLTKQDSELEVVAEQLTSLNSEYNATKFDIENKMKEIYPVNHHSKDAAQMWASGNQVVQNVDQNQQQAHENAETLAK